MSNPQNHSLKGNILIVDDNPANLELLSFMYNLEPPKPKLEAAALYCPFPARINPRSQRLYRYSLEWVCQQKLVRTRAELETFASFRISELVARAYPELTWDALKILGLWNFWLFFLDDLVDEQEWGKQPKQLETFNDYLMQVILSCSDNLSHPLAKALDNIIQRLPKTSSWFPQFAESVSSCLDATVWEAKNRATRSHPDIDTYIQMRQFTGAFPSISNLMCLIRLVDPALINQSLVQELTITASNCICWANDVASYTKEQKHGDFHNLVLLWQYSHQCSLPAAVTAAIELHNQEVYKFIQLSQKLLNSPMANNSELRRYQGILETWIRGNFDWQLNSKRYNKNPEI
jgi:5-epi-alpha-selinene synthase